MALTLHFHPLSSYCMKVLVGLYELDVPHEKNLVDFGDEAHRAAFLALSPIGKFPVVRDDARGRTVPESTIILEYLDEHFARRARLVPSEADRALECRLKDRFYDSYVHTPMQKIVGDKLRPEGQRDPLGVEEAKAQLRKAYAIADDEMRARTWALGEDFTMADCAAAPALFYASKVFPLDGRPLVAAYLDRLMARPSFARCIEEGRPFRAYFPLGVPEVD